jgi:protoheme ferro-lyase
LILFKWLLPLVLSFAFGLLYVQFLTIHPLKMSRYLLAATLAFVAAVASLAVGFRGWEFLLAVPPALASALAGYLLMAHQVLSREDPRPIPKLTRSQGDPGLGHTAVIYFTHGEPETYDPIGWINQFNEFDEQGIPFVPLVARPYFLHRLRKGYLRVGKSDHRKTHQQMLKSLEQAFRAAGDETTRFYLSFLDDNPRPDAAVIQALNDGASRIIVSEVFLTISNHTAEGEELIEELGVEAYGVPIEYTGPLYDSERLQSMFVHRANQHLGETDKSKVGILLVGHGQPEEWDVEWATETEQEIGFRQDVLERFEADGYRKENLSLAWMEFKKPKPAIKVEEFLKNGVEKVLFFSAAISADAMHSQYDVPALVSKARVPAGFPLINLGAWNDDPIVIQAIKEKIEAQMDKAEERETL